MNAQQELDALFEDAPPPGKKRVAVILGRFNPPTKGHYELINRVRTYIKAHPDLNLEAAPVVIIIGNDKKQKTPEEMMRNPLTVHERIVFMNSSGLVDGVKFAHAKNAFEALTGLRKNNMEPIAIAAGSDRIDDYMRILDEYFKTADGKPIKHEKIHVARDDDAIEKDKNKKQSSVDEILDAMKNGDDPAIDAVSGTLARRAVELGYQDEFAKIVGLEVNPKLANMLYAKVKKALDAGKETE